MTRDSTSSAQHDPLCSPDSRGASGPEEGGELARAPKLRDELVLSWQGPAGSSSLVVKDPSTARYFRFGETEALIVQSLDGAVPLQAIRRKAEERFGASLSLAAIEEFVARLRSLGL